MLGRDTESADPGIVEFLWTALRGEASVPFALVVVDTTARLGLAGRVTSDVEDVLGRESISLRTFVEDNADAFERG